MHHGGISSLAELAVEEPSYDYSHVQTIAEEVSPPFLASQSWPIAAEEAVRHLLPHDLIVFFDHV